MLEIVGKKGNPSTLLVWIYVGVATIKNRMEFPLKTKDRATTWSHDPIPGCTSGKNENSIVWKDTCTPVFTKALFTIAKTWKQPKCPSTDN